MDMILKISLLFAIQGLVLLVFASTLAVPAIYDAILATLTASIHPAFVATAGGILLSAGVLVFTLCSIALGISAHRRNKKAKR